jgi:hypothetical protein
MTAQVPFCRGLVLMGEAQKLSYEIKDIMVKCGFMVPYEGVRHCSSSVHVCMILLLVDKGSG